MTRTAVSSAEAPKPVGPYSQAITAGDLVFCAGQVGLDPATGELVDGGVVAQAERALGNLEAVLAAAGCSFADVVKTTIFLADVNDFGPVNEAYGRFVGDPPPARTTIGVGDLPKGARIEIEAIAVRPDR